jgi:hypothetical protein
MRTHVTTRLGYNPSPHTLQGVESGWAGNEMAPRLARWPPFILYTASTTELRHRHPRLGVGAPARQLARRSDARVPKNKGIHHVNATANALVRVTKLNGNLDSLYISSRDVARRGDGRNARRR